MRSPLRSVPSLLVAALFAATPAQAQVTRGNDTSGIIAWSPAAEATARAAAQAHCAGFGKVARMTGVVRRYGNYISFNCLWRPGVARYQLPKVHLRERVCHVVARGAVHVTPGPCPRRAVVRSRG